MRRILPILCVFSLVLASCSNTPETNQNLNASAPAAQNINSSLPVIQTIENKNSLPPAPAAQLSNENILLLSDNNACTIKVVQGKRVLVDDMISLVKSFDADARIGKVRDDICIDRFDFQQILDTDHILIHLPGGGIEHPNFGNIYVLTLSDKKLLPLTFYNTKYADKYASISISPDGKRGIFVEKNSPKELRFFRFDQNKDVVVKTLNSNETWDGTEFWSDVMLTADWISEKQAVVSIYKERQDPTEPESRVEVRKEKITLE